MDCDRTVVDLSTAQAIGEAPKIPCKYCSKDAMGDQTRLCDFCWELEQRIVANLDLAEKILHYARRLDLNKGIPNGSDDNVTVSIVPYGGIVLNVAARCRYFDDIECVALFYSSEAQCIVIKADPNNGISSFIESQLVTVIKDRPQCKNQGIIACSKWLRKYKLLPKKAIRYLAWWNKSMEALYVDLNRSIS